MSKTVRKLNIDYLRRKKLRDSGDPGILWLDGHTKQVQMPDHKAMYVPSDVHGCGLPGHGYNGHSPRKYIKLKERKLERLKRKREEKFQIEQEDL